MAQVAQAFTPISNHSTLSQSATPFMAHKVTAKETLSQIITDFYDVAYGSVEYRQAVTLLQHSNPEVLDINKIYPGQIIRLFDLQPGEMAYCPKPQAINEANPVAPVTDAEVAQWLDRNSLTLPSLVSLEQHWPINPAEQDAFFTLAWLEENYGILAASATAGFNTFDGLVSQSHRAFVADVKVLWQRYQAGKITQNQYNYQRQLALKAFARKVGPFEKLLFKGQTARQAVRINRRKAIPATAKIDRQLHRLSRMARLSKHGGIVLTAAGVAVGCHQIANTQDRHRKNEIFVETLGSAAVGTAASIGLGLLFAATPVGWVAALAIGTTAAFGSYAAGKGTAKFYNKNLRQYDIVSAAGVDRVCR